MTPTKPGFAAYEVKPHRGGLDWLEGDVSAPFGTVHVRADGGEGTLVMPDGRRLAIPAGKTVNADWDFVFQKACSTLTD